ncbi:helix-turn-helix transcriptional regulator [Nonomuraea sp. NPDC003709]|uniref:PadR family transcriptional regulator n=1 Tax=Nonomuraea sp. NPDC003709 TaxID=3154450 RepID=UPI0033B8F2A4
MNPRVLSLTEWIVLALVAEGPTYGFAVARLTAPTGAVGAIWQVPRPRVYRALDRLADLSLIEPCGKERGQGGPQRTVFTATAAGTSAVNGWLICPVEHIRDIRTEFLIKFALLQRSGADPRPLLDAQAERIEPIIRSLRRQRDQAHGFDHVVAAWRYETAEAALRLMHTARH